MTRLLLLLAVGCSAAPTDAVSPEEAEARVQAICEPWGAECRAASAEEIAPAAWARCTSQGSSCERISILWDLDLCTSRITACEAVVLHEIGHHVLCSSDELLADAFVVDHGGPARARALRQLLCDEYVADDSVERCAALSTARAERPVKPHRRRA